MTLPNVTHWLLQLNEGIARTHLEPSFVQLSSIWAILTHWWLEADIILDLEYLWLLMQFCSLVVFTVLLAALHIRARPLSETSVLFGVILLLVVEMLAPLTMATCTVASFWMPLHEFWWVGTSLLAVSVSCSWCIRAALGLPDDNDLSNP